MRRLVAYRPRSSSGRAIELWNSADGVPLTKRLFCFTFVKQGVSIWNFRMAFGKSKSHVDNLKLFLSGKFHGFGCVWDDCISSRGQIQKSLFGNRESAKLFFSDQVSCVFLSCFFDDIENHRDAIEQFWLVTCVYLPSIGGIRECGDQNRG